MQGKGGIRVALRGKLVKRGPTGLSCNLQFGLEAVEYLPHCPIAVVIAVPAGRSHDLIPQAAAASEKTDIVTEVTSEFATGGRGEDGHCITLKLSSRIL
jgi:hypothetical protein